MERTTEIIQYHDLAYLKSLIKIMETNLGWIKDTIYAIEEKRMDDEDEELRKFLG